MNQLITLDLRSVQSEFNRAIHRSGEIGKYLGRHFFMSVIESMFIQNNQDTLVRTSELIDDVIGEIHLDFVDPIELSEHLSQCAHDLCLVMEDVIEILRLQYPLIPQEEPVWYLRDLGPFSVFGTKEQKPLALTRGAQHDQIFGRNRHRQPTHRSIRNGYHIIKSGCF